MNLDRCRLYGFIDTAYLADRDPAELTRAMIEGGVNIIQVRAKNFTRLQRAELSRTVLGAAARYGVPIIINDDLVTTYDTGAEGVHLGQEDWAAIPPEKHERFFADVRIVGLSTHSLEQAQQAERLPVHYIGVGPVFATQTKPQVQPVGLELVKQVAGVVKLPFFAIGGITLENLDQVLAAGATRIAVVSAILKAPDVEAAAAAFKKRLMAG